MMKSYSDFKIILSAVMAAFLIAVSASRTSAADKPRDLTGFVKQHCVECHGAQKQEAELRLDTLAATIQNAEQAAVWIKALQRLEAGEMPPEDHAQPSEDERDVALAAIREKLHAAKRTGVPMTAGRGPRRLNRLEYQNTVNELLGIDLDLTKYLPEDNTLAGFDKVGRALSISPVLVERYLEAADAALKDALIEKPHVPSTTIRYTLWDCGRGRRTFVKNEIWAERDDAAILWYTNDKFFYCEQFRAPVRGKYRFRTSAYACTIGGEDKQDGRRIQMAVHGGHFLTTGRTAHLAALFDMEHEKPQVFEAVDLLDEGHTFKVTIAGRPPKSFNLLEFQGPALAVQWMEIEGPLEDGAQDRRKQLLFGSVDPKTATRADAEQLLRTFIGRAFRRPTTEADCAPYLAIMREQFDRGASFLEALHIGMQTVLCAPDFLFVDERPAVDEFTIANRLAYFLWGSMPDAELLAAAQSGRLHDADVRRQEAERLLRDPRSAFFAKHFLDGWLDLKKIDFTTPDKELYPEFDEPLRVAMLAETRTFFNELLEHDLSVTNVVDSDFAMLNERLARHYGMAGIKGNDIRKVSLPSHTVRGGMLTQASVLKVTADGTVTSPVLRGVWLLDRILGKPVPPPPPGVPGVEPDIRGATTIRDQLAKHRQTTTCASCHAKIDPPGFALENFDPIGGWREKYRLLKPEEKPIKVDGNWVKYVYGGPVEAGDELADGRRFADVAEFKKLLLADPESLAANVTDKLMTYALGREPDFVEHEEIGEIVARAKKSGYGLRTLICELVADEVFVSR